MSTAYHAKYFAHDLTRRDSAGDVQRLSMSLFDACVDLNPHQIEAALFAVRSPLSKGVLLADEVGLGKTIEAGLVLCQHWAERKRRLLVVCPASIRKQWSLELAEKFNLPNTILDARAYRLAQRDGNPRPFDQASVIIVSPNFASTMRNELRSMPWDFVVIDEAHQLRNAYRPSNKIGQGIRWALEDRRKILLTATPLQNSLLELYGLSTLIGDYIFGDLPSFRSQYTTANGDLPGLKERLRSFCKRTLRRQVLEYIKYTERRAITRPFHPTDDEQKLYDAVSAFLQRDDTYAVPHQQRQLITLILRKLLASSSRAVAGTLETMRNRLIELRDGLEPEDTLLDRYAENEELEDDYLDDILGGDAEDDEGRGEDDEPKIDRRKLDAEIAELERYIQWAHGIGVDTKTRAFLSALGIGFTEMERMGAARKALVFTESRRTQDYLKDFLEANGYAGQVVLFNGTNAGPEAKAIYDKWVETNAGTGRSSGSRAVDSRTALVEHFRDHATIMIATEAGATGVNLQFCSLVVNFELPWNPQRVEQRIGRCHRYGQKHDVVVINFLNERNEADRRVLELLQQKFTLFSGVFGASDEVLGTIESGVDFEKRILAIYQECRTPDEIEAAFTALQAELEDTIKSKLDETRQLLLEHFDEDVHARLKGRLDNTREQLDRVGRRFWQLTCYILTDHASFDDADLCFDLTTPPRPDFKRGHYRMISKDRANVTGDFLYRISHPLGEFVIETGKTCPTPTAVVSFDITNHPTRVALVEAIKGKCGWLTLRHLEIESFEREQYLLFSAVDDAGASLDAETCEKLFSCAAGVEPLDAVPEDTEQRLDAEARRHAEATIARSLEQNNEHFNQAREALEKWAEDMLVAAEKELADTKAQIKAMRRQARQAETLHAQQEIQEKIRELERKQRRQRQEIFDTEDQITEQRDRLIENLERRLSQKTTTSDLFTIRWAVT